jgi:hypothetical protein
MKRSIQSLVIKTGYSPSGTMEGGFGSIRGGTAANDLQANSNCGCTNNSCNGSTNDSMCVNQASCTPSTNKNGCTNQNHCQPSSNAGGCINQVCV